MMRVWRLSLLPSLVLLGASSIRLGVSADLIETFKPTGVQLNVLVVCWFQQPLLGPVVFCGVRGRGAVGGWGGGARASFSSSTRRGGALRPPPPQTPKHEVNRRPLAFVRVDGKSLVHLQTTFFERS